jgi:hypothetical protein
MMKPDQERALAMAAFRSENEKAIIQSLPALEQMEAGRPIGAVVPMSRKAQRLLRDRIETIDFLMHEDDVTWN